MRNLIAITLFSILFLSAYGQNKTHSGFDVGYSSKGFIPITVYLGANKLQYGLTVGLPIKTGTKGDYHPLTSWTELPNKGVVVKKGEYYLPIMFNLSQPLQDNFYLGAGLGYTFKTLYTNMHDATETIGTYGSYYIKTPGNGQIDYIMFLNYITPYVDGGNLSIKVFYSGLMGIGASLGYAF